MKYILIFILVQVILIGFLTYKADSYLNNDFTIQDTVRVEIPHGTSIYKVVELMNEKELLKPNWFFKQFLKFYSRYTGNIIFAGKYIFSGETNNLYLIQQLYEGGIKEVIKITFPEGTMPNEMASSLQKKSKNRFFEIYGLSLF